MHLKIIAAVLIAMLSVIFAVQNNVAVTVNFLIWRFDSSLALVLLSALALGAVVVSLLTMPGTVRQQWLAARQKRRIEELESLCGLQKKKLSEGAPRPAAAMTPQQEKTPNIPKRSP